jgi:hypothetical protein
MAENETQKIPSGAYLLAEVRGDGFAALDNFLLRSWESRLNRFLDYLPGTWSAKLPATFLSSSAALVVIKAPSWSTNAALTLGEARQLLSDLVAGVDVTRLSITGTLPASSSQIASAAENAASSSPLAKLADIGELVLALVVVGVVVAVVVSSERGKR